MSEHEPRNRKKIGIYASLAAALIAAGVAEEFTRRRYYHKKELPLGFDSERYRQRLLPLTHELVSPDFLLQANVVAAVAYEETDRKGKPPLTAGEISRYIRNLELIKPAPIRQDVVTTLDYLQAFELVEKVANPRYVSADDDDFAYQSKGFLPEGGAVGRDFAPVFYGVVRFLEEFNGNL